MSAENVIRNVCLEKISRLEKTLDRAGLDEAADARTVAALALAALRQAREVIGSGRDVDASEKIMLQALGSQLRVRLKQLSAPKGGKLPATVQETIRMLKVASTWHK